MRLCRALQNVAAFCGLALAAALVLFVLAWWFVFPVIGLLWSIGWIR